MGHIVVAECYGGRSRWRDDSVIKLFEIAILHSKIHARSLHELFYFSFNLVFYCIVKYSLYMLLCLYKIMLAVSFMIVNSMLFIFAN